jgi:hypothetical protein
VVQLEVGWGEVGASMVKELPALFNVSMITQHGIECLLAICWDCASQCRRAIREHFDPLASSEPLCYAVGQT